MDNKAEFSIKDLVFPAIGYLFVALVCIMSGKSLHYELSLENFIIISPEQFLYWLLLVPVFINRVIMYEQSSDKDISNVGSEWKKLSIQLPLIILIFTLFVFGFLNFSFVNSGFSTYQINVDKIIPVFICVLPLYIQAYISWKKWAVNKAKGMFNFRNYIFFPAISTCVISFMVGWTEFKNMEILTVTIVSILAYYSMSFYDKTSFKGWKFSDWSMLLVTLVGFAYFFLFTLPLNLNSQESVNWEMSIIVLLSCIMMTLIMGITETWWLIKDLENKAKFESSDLDFYEKRINKVTASLPLIMPLTIFNPQTNNYFYLILLYAILLCLIWFYGQSINNRYWRWIRFVFGISLPVLFAVSLRLGDNGVSFINDKAVANIIPAITILFAVIAFIRSNYKKNNTQEFTLDKQIACIIIVAMTLILWAISQFFSISNENLLQKINLLLLFYSVMILVFLGEALLKLYKDKSDDDNFTNSSNSTLTNVILFFISSRPITSMLSGLLAFIIVFQKLGNVYLSVIKILPIILITMLGFVYNDIYDRTKDILAKKLRPITTGKLHSKVAFRYTLIISLLALCIELLFNNFFTFLVILVILIAVISYSPISRKIPLHRRQSARSTRLS